MITVGTRVIVTDMWDWQAVEEVVGRRVEHGEEGEVVEVDEAPHPDDRNLDTFTIQLDKGGRRVVLCRGEVTRTQS